jgi:hypothetical protein
MKVARTSAGLNVNFEGIVVEHAKVSSPLGRRADLRCSEIFRAREADCARAECS